MACVCSRAQTSCACACLRYTSAANTQSRIAFVSFSDENPDGYQAEDALDTGCLGVHIVVRHLMSSDNDFNGCLR